MQSRCDLNKALKSQYEQKERILLQLDSNKNKVCFVGFAKSSFERKVNVKAMAETTRLRTQPLETVGQLFAKGVWFFVVTHVGHTTRLCSYHGPRNACSYPLLNVSKT